jgi:hypothetical protein
LRAFSFFSAAVIRCVFFTFLPLLLVRVSSCRRFLFLLDLAVYVPNFLGGARIRPDVLFFDSGGGAGDGGGGDGLVGGLAVNDGGGGGSSGGGGGLVGFTFMIPFGPTVCPIYVVSGTAAATWYLGKPGKKGRVQGGKSLLVSFRK